MILTVRVYYKILVSKEKLQKEITLVNKFLSEKDKEKAELEHEYLVPVELYTPPNLDFLE